MNLRRVVGTWRKRFLKGVKQAIGSGKFIAALKNTTKNPSELLLYQYIRVQPTVLATLASPQAAPSVSQSSISSLILQTHTVTNTVLHALFTFYLCFIYLTRFYVFFRVWAALYSFDGSSSIKHSTWHVVETLSIMLDWLVDVHWSPGAAPIKIQFAGPMS